ncbi:MAG: tail fiber domain-containing protein [Puia sp.]
MKKYFKSIVAPAILIIAFASHIDGQNAGIGTNSPNSSARLDITGVGKGLLIPRMDSLSIRSIANPANGLLVYDSVKNQLMVNAENASVPNWQTLVANSGWALNGNAGTSPAVNFIGTTDDKPLLFKINNQWSGIIDSAYATTMLGSLTGKNNSRTFGNTAFGAGALAADVHGQGTNTAMGTGALGRNTTGYGNTAIGTGALDQNTTGNGNTADGAGALNGNKSGSFNTAVGENALFSSSNADNFGSEDANYNTAFGVGALNPDRGSYNTVFGSTGGGGGSSNTIFGSGAMPVNIGNFNTVSGYHAMAYLKSGDNNAVLGDVSLGISGDPNNYDKISQTTAVGYQTLAKTDGVVNAPATDSWGNTVFGYHAGSFSHNGSHNCFIGAESDITNGSCFNTTVLGHATTAAISNVVRVGNPATTSIGGPVGWSVISDGRVKKNIKENIPGLSFITRLRPVTYNINTAAIESIQQARISEISKTAKQSSKTLSTQMAAAYQAKEKIVYSGFVAQEVQQAAKNIHYDFNGVDVPKTENELYALRYESFVVPLVKSVQELASQSKQLVDSTMSLKSAYQKINEQLDALEKKIK